MIPPSLYQSIERCGTEGGAMDSLPVTLKCGSLMCGREIFMPEKNPLIASTTLLTLFLAATIGVVMADFMPFHTEVAVDLIPLKMLLTVLFTELNTVQRFNQGLNVITSEENHVGKTYYFSDGR